MFQCSRIVVATDEEWTDGTPLAANLSLAALTAAQLEICQALQAEIVVVWLKPSARLLGPWRDQVAENVALDGACSVLVVPTRTGGERQR